ncbi:nephrin [Caerostris darwini]|uniref:Nephrin n=1 Tax=Caerostris darwini TaxID=1538125 RepID=A0AAV4WL67_9ARAC|nr:nephrin [Caerostris darwini]
MDAGVPGIKIKSSSNLDDTTEFPEIHAIIGSTVYLPCPLSPPASDDAIALVLWYRLDLANPIYTLDARSIPSEAKHFSSKVLGSRAYFNVSRGAFAHIKLEPVEEDDEGEYRCRIDYKRGRTLNRLVKLNVIVPVKKVLIKSVDDKMYSGLIGPFLENERLILICEAVGGRPIPVVLWKKGKTVIHGSISSSKQGWIRNEIVFDRLRRQDLLSELLCQASNNNFTAPVYSAVTIDLNLKPLSIHITNPPLSVLTAGETLELNCQSEGSKPPAQITWTKGTESVTHLAIHNVYGRISVSSLTITIVPEDNGKKLVCRAQNPQLPESALQDSLDLNVQFTPVLTLVFGASVQSEHIREGSDVYFECNIQSNPPITDVRWRFQSHILEHSPSSGVVIRNHSLLLHNVSRKNRGVYQCVAENDLGRGKSEEVVLRIQHSPMCVPRQQKKYGIPWQEKTNVTCNVEADPDDVTFTWTLNNITVASEQMGAPTLAGSRSIFELQPKTKMDYGTLQCHARNEVGTMKEPCVMNVIPAGPPPPLQNCLILNQTTDSLSVSCEPDETSKQPTYHMEMYDMEEENLIVNITSKRDPSFSVKGLPEGSSFIVALYTTNSKGKSETVAITTSTLRSSEDGQGRENRNLMSIIVLVSLVVLGTLALLAIIAGILVFRSKTETAVMGATTTETELTEKLPSAKHSFDESNPYVYHTTELPSEFVHLTPKSTPNCLYESLMDTHQKSFGGVLCKTHSLSEEDIEVIMPVIDR